MQSNESNDSNDSNNSNDSMDQKMEIDTTGSPTLIPASKLFEFISCNHCKNRLVQPFVTTCCLKLFCFKCIKDCVICPFCSSERISIRSENFMEKFLSSHGELNEEDLGVFSDCALCFNFNNCPVVNVLISGLKITKSVQCVDVY